MGEEFTDEVDEKVVAEEYKVWKKNAPFLYDVIITHGLDWPSLTVQWLPKRVEVAGGDYAEHKVILGTHTSASEANHLMLATVRLPTEDAELDARKYDEEKGELGGYGSTLAKIEVTVRMVHDGEVNRARYCPHNPFLISTKTPSADVLVYDWSKHPAKPVDNVVRAQLRLKGHSKEGYGLAWSNLSEGRIASAGDDKLVCIWETAGGTLAPATASSSSSGGPTVMHAARTFTGHTEVVEDVAFHRHSPHIWASCGDDETTLVWDMRESSSSVPSKKIQGHKGDVMSLAFNPFNEILMLTAATDNSIKMWDLRNTTVPLHTFMGHNDHVLNVGWAPFSEHVFASTGADRRVMVWDCSRIGAEQSAEDAEDGPPELLFVHGGHTSKVSDFGWCETEEWYVASVAEDNILQVWSMAESIYDDAGEADEKEATAAAASSAAAASASGGKARKRARMEVADDDLE